MKAYQDFCETLAKELFDVIETNGSLLTWHKSWDSAGCKQLPEGVSGVYHASNLFTLFFAQYRDGYKSNQWLTFNQIKQRGGSVKKGSKGYDVYFWKMLDSKTVVDDKEVESKKPLFKSYYVFNLDQTTLEQDAIDQPLFSSEDVDTLIHRFGVTVSHFGGKAYYNPKDDVIVLPEQHCFSSKENYYAVLLHELVHWTGAREDRLPRECFDRYSQNDKDRAQEELIAEVGSLFLASHFGLQAGLEHHASYVQAWKQCLSQQEIMASVNKASKAFAWILDRASDVEMEKAA